MLLRRTFLATTCVVGAVVVAPAQAEAALAFDPHHFNVFSTGNINYQSSDYQGVAGTVGHFQAHGFSLHDVGSAGPGTGVSLYAGGNVTIAGAINHGGVEAGGNVNVNNASIAGHVYAGGNLSGAGGTITGNATLGGSKLVGPQLTVTGSVSPGQAFNPTVDVNAFADYYRHASQSFSSITPNTAVQNNWGGLSANLASGLNVVNMTASDFNSAWGFNATGSSDAYLVVNLTDTGNVSFDSVTWNFAGGMTASNVLVNVADAAGINFTGGNHVSLLAPDVETHFAHGLLVGQLIAGDLTGSGQVNDGTFGGWHLVPPPPGGGGGGGSPVPEPATILFTMFGMSVLAFGVRHRRPPIE